MAKTIYDPDAKIEIGTFVKAATEKTAIFIPDLQRPYVWTPDQIILLVDSFFKGWPFGSLLTWQIFPEYDENNRLIEGIPYRRFYTKVSRVDGVESIEATERDLPSGRDGDLMILDGQQRLQSLILALGNTHGLCLYDYQWDASLPVPHGMRKNTNRYSTAFLYLNLVKFMEEMQKHNNICNLISLENVLEWVIVRPEDHVGRGNVIRSTEGWQQ